MLQAAVCDGVAFDAFSFSADRLSPAEVDIGRCEVVDALVITDVIVVFDEGLYLAFEVTGQVVVVEQDAVLQRLMPSLDLSLGLEPVSGRLRPFSLANRKGAWGSGQPSDLSMT
jgi:hypothetical protein